MNTTKNAPRTITATLARRQAVKPALPVAALLAAARTSRAVVAPVFATMTLDEFVTVLTLGC